MKEPKNKKNNYKKIALIGLTVLIGSQTISIKNANAGGVPTIDISAIQKEVEENTHLQEIITVARNTMTVIGGIREAIGNGGMGIVASLATNLVGQGILGNNSYLNQLTDGQTGEYATQLTNLAAIGMNTYGMVDNNVNAFQGYVSGGGFSSGNPMAFTTALSGVQSMFYSTQNTLALTSAQKEDYLQRRSMANRMAAQNSYATGLATQTQAASVKNSEDQLMKAVNESKTERGDIQTNSIVNIAVYRALAQNNMLLATQMQQQAAHEMANDPEISTQQQTVTTK